MESLLEGIEENRLDALYLFITDVLRDGASFRRFFANLMSVLPQNYSVHRIEAGHEFLKQMALNNQDQRRLFRTITELESLRTLIVSDGYVQRKDYGALSTPVFLQELPRATSLVNLDLHRMELKSDHDVELLSLALESISESLEELRLTGLILSGGQQQQQQRQSQEVTSLDPVIEALVEFQHLRSFTFALYPQNIIAPTAAAEAAAAAAAQNNAAVAGGEGNDGEQQEGRVQQAAEPEVIRNTPGPKVSPRMWHELCLLSTLQDLTIRHMQLDDESCREMSTALRQTAFLSCLDLRQNPDITKVGYGHIARALELNFSSWCTVAVDDLYFQSQFNVLIELNQHNRADVVRNVKRSTLAQFIEDLEETNPNPTAIWYFLRIHDNVRTLLASYMTYKSQINLRNDERKRLEERKRKAATEGTVAQS
uniref:Uncharacterized protein n=1 Tax=Entomoneis paludosa TaxID=265537 RepID=A0A7S2YD51_9STRA|mmetsp:Transcript_28076/g.58787  ORF Transcript_28076/g.58787 Transcript_28076/m.58787 type:complete len:426 (+) Transcript_28076:246-1523(+)|eukprot:CAMPEP_0172441290 /NCGR_PEP_ID=MMETSP1065-20121228/1835_1 /TAXON_ID=265537 /ORGANISM="Amphiprora paludosa, Strain CCMP125" /LENGTH=425 /DNA_ID=CAMNT_0013190555 /DNA_START=174 /DNA_END=1451 /DNA_ORIENTATION=-